VPFVFNDKPFGKFAVVKVYSPSPPQALIVYSIFSFCRTFKEETSVIINGVFELIL
jgi:hypothetical protein